MSPKSLNILYLCADSGIPFWGVKGGSIHMREIVSCFMSKNCEVTVIARESSNGAHESRGFSAYDIPGARADKVFPYINSLFGEGKLKLEFEDFLRNSETEALLNEIHSKSEIDIIYERYSLFNAAGLNFCRMQEIPHVLEVNAPLIEEATKYRDLALPGFAAAVEEYLFSKTDHIIAVSNELKDYIRSKYPDSQITVVPNGVRADHFSSKGSESDSDINNKFVIGFLGSLKPWHGVEILIDSFAGIADSEDSNRLLIIGDNKKAGPRLARKCRNLKIDGKVGFTGAVEYDRIPEMLHKADVLVAPYPEMDNFYFSSLKIFEYMAAGKAIVASNIGQISAVLTHEKTALLVPPGDPMALRRALERLKDDPDLRRRLGDRARIEARTRHTWSQRADKILDVIDKLKAGELQT